MEKKITQFLVLLLSITTGSLLVLCVVVHMAPPPPASLKIEAVSQPTQLLVANREDAPITEDIPDVTIREPVVDRATFEVISSSLLPNNHQYAKDKNFVYRNVYGELRIVAEAVPSGFELVGVCYRGEGGGTDYVKDRIHVFCNDRIIPEADPETFTVLGYIESTIIGELPTVPMVAKDKNHVYFGSVMMGGIDPKICTKDTLAVCIAGQGEYIVR